MHAGPKRLQLQAGNSTLQLPLVPSNPRRGGTRSTTHSSSKQEHRSVNKNTGCRKVGTPAVALLRVIGTMGPLSKKHVNEYKLHGTRWCCVSVCDWQPHTSGTERPTYTFIKPTYTLIGLKCQVCFSLRNLPIDPSFHLWMSLLIVQSSFQKTLAFFPPADFGIYLHCQIRSIESDENKQSRKEMGDAGSVYGATLSHQNDFFHFDPFFFPFSLSCRSHYQPFPQPPFLLCHNSSWQLCALFWAKLRSSLGHMQQHPWSSQRRDP